MTDDDDVYRKPENWDEFHEMLMDLRMRVTELEAIVKDEVPKIMLDKQDDVC